MKDYRDIGIEIYGDKCEICGYGVVEVHHISYQEQWEFEQKIRDALKKKKDITWLLEEAKKEGFLEWSKNQLTKDNRSTNLSVLCGNCHGLMHLMDVGKRILKALPKRR